MAQTGGPQATFDENLVSRLEGNWLLTRKIFALDTLVRQP